MNKDKLEEIFTLQKELNKRIGVDSDCISGDDKESVKWILNYSRALSQELAELIDSVPWKWWAKYQVFDRQNAQIELIDMLHFVVSLAQVMGMDADDVFELYTKKHRLNHKRQDDGYAVKDENDNKEI